MPYSSEDAVLDLKQELRYLKLLSKQFPTIASACTEIINLQAILNLPKSTEHFLSDIHGEYEPFNHVLRNGSGNIKRKITEVFGDILSEKEIKALSTLIYYPEQKLEIIHKQEENIEEWYKITIYRLIEVSRKAAFKYTRMKVRKALPAEFAYIIEELMHKGPEEYDKEEYYSEIINSIITVGRADEFIIAMSKLIQRLVIDRLHIVGDIFDRGPGAGWQGNNKETQFDLKQEFEHARYAGGWQTGTQSILSMAPMEGSLKMFEEAGIKNVRKKSLTLTAYMMYLIDTKLRKYGFGYSNPTDDEKRGGHVALEHDDAIRITKAMKENKIIPDFRFPNIIRLAPVALYVSFEDVYEMVERIIKIMENKEYENFGGNRGVVA